MVEAGGQAPALLAPEGSASCRPPPPSPAPPPAEGDQKRGGVLGKAASIAASALGVGDAFKGRKDDSPAAAAARYLGADAVDLSVDGVKGW